LGLPAPDANDPLSDVTLDAASGMTRSSLYGHGICRKTLALAISSSTVSYDIDDGAAEGVYSKFDADFVKSGVTGSPLAAWTDKIGSLPFENVNGTERSVGSPSADFGTDCTLKKIGVGSVTAGGSYQGGLSAVAGVCPEAPAIKGSYLGAGAAFFAHTTAIRTDGSLTVNTGSGIDKQSLPVDALRVKSYAASLSGGVARIEVPIPETNLFAVITPESLWRHQALNGRLMPGAMLTFRAIGKQSRNLALGFGGSGSYVVTWNDAQFGGDYDMDLVGFIRWTLRKSKTLAGKWELEVLTDVLNHNAGAQGSQGFSIIGVEAAQTSGTTNYMASGKYITHGSNDFAATGTQCGDAAESDPVAFALHCRFTDAGFYVSDVGPSDGFAWPTTYQGEAVDFINTGHRYTTTVSTKFLVSKESGKNSSDVALRDPLWYLAKYGSFDTGEKSSTPWEQRRSLPDAKPDAASGSTNVNWDQQHNNGSDCTQLGHCADGEPDGYFLARRPELLERRLNEVFDRELGKSNTAVSVSSAQLNYGSFKYVAKFTESDTLRYGTVEATQVNSDGKFVQGWDAGEQLAAASDAKRQVITNTPVNGVEAGVAFNAALAADRLNPTDALSPFLTAMAGSSDTPELAARKLIAYMRGSRGDEGTLFRNRSQRPSNIMGPVVSSNPWVQDPAKSARFTDGDFPGGPSYFEFISSRAAQNKVLWVGSHDGMLHGFEATTGAPLLSYVPSPVVSRLLSTFSSSTAQAVPLVDGSPFAADVLRGAGADGAEWRTYLFGGLGRGGKAVFALDVTDTGSVSGTSVTSGDLQEANASTLFKWIFTSADDGDLGFVTTGPTEHRTSGQAHQVVRLNNGKFGLLVPNGYQSTNGRAALFILFIDGPGVGAWTETGSNPNFRKLLTLNSDAGNGLMGVTWVDLNNDGTADVVYGTDLHGNVWKFDIRSADPASWGGAFKRASTATPGGMVNIPFFTTTACTRTSTGVSTSCANEIAITTNPVATQPPFGGVMISFGTGKALASGDFPNAAMANRFISVWDKGRYPEDQVFPPPDVAGFTAPVLPSLGARFSELLLRRNTDGQVYRVKVGASNVEVPVPADSDDVVFNPSINDGWYFNFPSEGEQLISSPTARRSFVSFTSVRSLNSTETQQTCVTDPNGTFYAVNPSTGGAIKGLLKVVTNDSIVSSPYGQGTYGDQEITVTPDQTKGTLPGQINVRLLGNGTDDLGAVPAPNLRLQWREIPGMKTK
jgi:type IV pilus assembly protein PilY1